jgi:aromatic-L-amino-acid decarboxylase
VLVRHHTALERAFAIDGAYLRDTQQGSVQFRERGPQLTRSARALKLYLSLKVFGLDAFKQAIQRGIDLAEHAERLLAASGKWEVVTPAMLGIVCFRRAGASDEQTDELVRRAIADGFAAPSTTILDGRTVARLCTINPRTTNQDIERTIERLEHLSR